MINCMNKLLKDESGAAAIEYGMMVALIAVAIIAAVTMLGGSLKGVFEEAANRISNAKSAK
ncbi:Flp family type IVb pilin [Candidatus Liberibacter asiaticus]|uniref:Flp family type IVb pilin n=1 Tax=Liberibacter asiaticus TaxID=34021 RepID=UPI00044ED674|nr:Flp family type IVb pilin [Candidatus Liberibacter asiaticus]ALK07189.1 Flp family type IVb pilin [Candidatus Liberibacter asiaticus]QNF76462.1 Flp family type IVb pilin [Candidatus Liberibacter asiaticus]UCZ50748.1 Flp family type IVb pilin [Candidatus Liberibacter asiaticus]WCM57836.1 Flp family type IVb pilin [Candidatus Liberibacter asiaticus]WLD01822.1 Flp family type IVb pilin [Candidatus Liberibacter asiaticus]